LVLGVSTGPPVGDSVKVTVVTLKVPLALLVPSDATTVANPMGDGGTVMVHEVPWLGKLPNESVEQFEGTPVPRKVIETGVFGLNPVPLAETRVPLGPLKGERCRLSVIVNVAEAERPGAQ
jgi:hypothetical protein